MSKDVENIEEVEKMFDQALEISERHLAKAVEENPDMEPYIVVAMIEAAVNYAASATSPADVISILNDLIDQMENAAEDDDDDDDDDDEEDEK